MRHAAGNALSLYVIERAGKRGIGNSAKGFVLEWPHVQEFG